MNMKKTIMAAILIILMSNTAAALIEEDWAYGKRNVIPADITGVRYDFEEGENCEPFVNQHHGIAEFMPVPSLKVGMSDYRPSYVTFGGSLCGATRCRMNIYPSDNQMDWIYLVNGRSAFAPIICCETPECLGGFLVGECYPGGKSQIEFKENVNYISFLVSTGSDLQIRLYNFKGSYNLIRADTIHVNYDRINGEPSNFTRFSINTGAVDIDRLDLSGSFNAWHIDDLVIGTSFILPTPEPTPEEEYMDYTHIAENAKKLLGEKYQEHMLGYDYNLMGYMKVEIFGYLMDFWNPDSKTFEFGNGISDEGLVIWAYNQPYFNDDGSKDLVKWCTSEGMLKHDFKVEVNTLDIRPGDVFFIDCNDDGKPDKIGMVTKPGDGGANIIISEKEYGVHTDYSSVIESTPGFMGYYRLPEKIKGGHNPIPKSKR